MRLGLTAAAPAARGSAERVWSAADLDLAEVRRVAYEVRDFLVERFHDWKVSHREPLGPDAVVSRGMCRVAAHTLACVLATETGAPWTVMGGWERLYNRPCDSFVNPRAVPGGMVDRDGRWRGHYWAASGRDPAAPQVPRIYADVAADQFGHDAVVVALEDDHRYRANLRERTIYDELGAAALHWGDQWAQAFLEQRAARLAAAPSPGLMWR